MEIGVVPLTISDSFLTFTIVDLEHGIILDISLYE
jgi:hypothetical protein